MANGSLADALVPPDLGDMVGQRVREALPSPTTVAAGAVIGALMFGFFAWYGAKAAEALYDAATGS